jgi:hypothetical protein
VAALTCKVCAQLNPEYDWTRATYEAAFAALWTMQENPVAEYSSLVALRMKLGWISRSQVWISSGISEDSSVGELKRVAP